MSSPTPHQQLDTAIATITTVAVHMKSSILELAAENAHLRQRIAALEAEIDAAKQPAAPAP